MIRLMPERLTSFLPMCGKIGTRRQGVIELFLRPLALLCFDEKEKPVLCQLLFCYRASDRNFKLCNVHDLPVSLERRIFEPDFLSLLQWTWFKKGHFMFHFRHPVLVLYVLSLRLFIRNWQGLISLFDDHFQVWSRTSHPITLCSLMNIIDCMVVVLGDDPGANSSQKEQGTGISRK